MTCKMTLFYNQYNAGFSETFFHPSTDPVTLQELVPNALYKAAAAFRHVSVILKAVRFSSVIPPKKSILWVPSPRAQGTRFSDTEPGPDAVSTTAVYVLSSTTGQRRRIWCRGLADLDVIRDPFGNDIESAELQKLRNTYFLALYKAGFAIRYGQRPPDAGLTWKKVYNVGKGSVDEFNPNRCYFSINENAVSIPPGTMVQFDGVPSTLPRWPRVNQIISAANTGTNTAYVIAYQLPGGTTVFPAKMRVTLAQSALATISQWSFERFGEHKTGRPFGSLRGRSKGVSLSR